MLNFNHLYYFYVIAREGSVSAASRLLNVSQPSLSAQIKILEESLSVSLFDRRGKRLIMTPEGRRAYGFSTQMFELATNMLQELQKGPATNIPVRVGVSEQVERPFAVNIVKSLVSTWAENVPPAVNMSTGKNEELLLKLREWNLDVLITNQLTTFEDAEVLDTLSMAVFLIAPSEKGVKEKAFSCTSRDVPRLLDRYQNKMALPQDRLRLRTETDEFLLKIRRSLAVAFESDTLATIARAITDQMGVGFLPLPYIDKEFSRGEMVVFGPPEGFWKHNIFLVSKREKKSSPAVKGVLQAFANIKQEAAQVLRQIPFSNNLDKFLGA